MIVYFVGVFLQFLENFENTLADFFLDKSDVSILTKNGLEPYSEKGGKLQVATYRQKAVCLNFVCCIAK
jgi:hypothetical protein